ncbi:MAG: amidohydrolase family protein [Pseudomonadota bacterium]
MKFYTCTPHAPVDSEGGSGPMMTSAGDKRTTVDIHCHMMSDRAAALARPHFTIDKEPSMAFASDLSRKVNVQQQKTVHEKLTSIDVRLADMDAMGVDIQVISPAPTQYYYWLEPELGRDTARIINDDLAECAANNSERFVALGTVPLQHTELAIEELNRCVNDLGLRGIEISSHVNGEELAQKRLEPFFARVEELGILIFLHPLGFTEGQRLTNHYFNNVIGNAMESTIAVSHLIFEGVLDRYPGLKICIAHGGGYLPMYTGRMDHAHSAREDCCQHIDAAPSSYLAKLYFDTVIFEPDQLDYLIKKFGAEHILLGTDYPYDMGESDPIGFIQKANDCSDEALNQMLGGNALSLLGLTATR